VYSVSLSRQAARSLRRIEAKQRETIRGRIELLARDPRDPRLDVKRLVGRSGFRLRVGDWRVLYEVDDAVRIIAVEDVLQRGSANR
jgi:mRNA interferase RelE/StbE